MDYLCFDVLVKLITIILPVVYTDFNAEKYSSKLLILIYFLFFCYYVQDSYAMERSAKLYFMSFFKVSFSDLITFQVARSKSEYCKLELFITRGTR